MAFYFDPGCGRLLTSTDGITVVENETYSPYSGTAFTGTGGFAFAVPLPSDTSRNVSRTVRLKLSVYCENMNIPSSANDFFQVGFARSTDAGSFSGSFGLGIAKNSNNIFAYPFESTVQHFENFSTLGDGFHNLAFTFNTCFSGGACDESCSFAVDGNTYSATSHRVTSNAYALFSDDRYIIVIFPATTAGTFYVSNVFIETESETSSTLIDRECIPQQTQAIKLPMSNTSTDFTLAQNGEYIGTAAGQKLLQTVNTTELTATHDGTTPIGKLIVYGNPGYRVGSGIMSASSISETGGTVTAHGTTTLSSSADAYSMVAWETDAGTVLSDLNGLKVGWQI